VTNRPDSTGHVEGSLVSAMEIIITSGAKVECFCGFCSGGANNGQVCNTNDDCPNGTCVAAGTPGTPG